MKCILKFVLIFALISGVCYVSRAADEPTPTPSATELADQGAANALTVRINEVNFMAKGMIAGKMLKAYQRSVEIDPNHIVGWIGQCRYYLNAPPIAGGSVDKAETYAREVLNRVPFLGHVEMGLVEEKRGNLEAEHFSAALADQPEHGEAVAGLKRVTAEAEA